MAVVAKISELALGDVVSFQCYGNAVAPVIEGTLIGTTSGMGLRAPEAALLNHSNTYPAIPEGDVIIPADYTQLEYLTIRKQTGVTDTPEPNTPVYTVREIAVPWIIPASVTRQHRKVIRVTIEDFDDSQLPLLKKILRNNGFEKTSFSVSGSD